MVSPSVDELLLEMESGFVVPEQYSRPTIPAKLSGLMVTTMLAVIAVLGSMLLCEMTDSSDQQH